MASFTKTLIAASLAMQASAGAVAANAGYNAGNAAPAGTTIKINVGQNNLTFTPDNVKAKVGDLLEFHFFPKNHSVVQGDLNNPCAPPKAGGFFSGFMPTTAENETVFTVEVKTTDPIVFYCSQNTATHCKSGMSGIINPASADQIQKYRDAAKTVQSAISPPKVAGGKLSKVAVSNPSSTGAAAPTNTGIGGTTETGTTNGADAGNNAGAGAGGAAGNGTTPGVVQSAAGAVKAGLGGMAGVAIIAMAWL